MTGPVGAETQPKEPTLLRQGSFGSNTSSLLGHIASQAKELVKETKRQSSQEGLLSQVDKLKSKTKEKLTEVKHSSMGSSGDESSFLSPLEHVRKGSWLYIGFAFIFAHFHFATFHAAHESGEKEGWRGWKVCAGVPE